MSQIRAVLSYDAVTIRDPSGLNAAECTASPWPRSTAISFAVAASQIRAVLSDDAVTMCDPSGLNARALAVAVVVHSLQHRRRARRPPAR